MTKILTPKKKTKPSHPLPTKAKKTRIWRKTDVKPSPRLTFNVRAWLKLQFLCHLGDAEVGAFAISDPKAPLRIIDLALVKQTCSVVSVEFDDEAVADYFENQIELGRQPESFARIWVHTHPGDSPAPSGVDEETFARVFGRCDWAVMFILARGGATYCRLRVSASKRAASDDDPRPVTLSEQLPVDVDYQTLQSGMGSSEDMTGWHEEYQSKVTLDQMWALHPADPHDEAVLWHGDLEDIKAEFDTLSWPDDFEELDALMDEDPSIKVYLEQIDQEGDADAI